MLYIIEQKKSFWLQIWAVFKCNNNIYSQFWLPLPSKGLHTLSFIDPIWPKIGKIGNFTDFDHYDRPE